MPKSNPTNSLKPGFSTGGSFQALAVESIESDSESDSPTTPIIPSHRTPSIAISTSTKKGRAKQRARDRARKSAGNSSLPDPTEDQPPVTTPTNGTTLRSGRTIITPTTPKASPLPKKPDHQSLESQNSEPAKPLRPPSPPPPLPPPEIQSPTSSSSVSMVNSLSSSPSSTDLDDEEDDYEESAPSRAGEGPEDLKAHQSERDSSLVIDQGEKWNEVYNSNAEDSAKTPTMSMPSTMQTEENITHQRQNTAESSPLVTPTVAAHDAQYGADHNPTKKWQAVLTRVIWSLVMVGVFVGLMTMGHVYLIVLVFIIQFSVFREVTNLFQVGYKASAKEHAKKQAVMLASGHRISAASIERKRIKDIDNNRWSKVMSWYFFCAVNYFLYGESIIYYFKHIVFIDAYLLPFARHHRFISLLLYLIGFLAFVTNLVKGQLRRQFGLFSWIHMSLLLIVASGQFMVNNILEGMIWFWVPASLVIMNDVAAYVFGMLFGRHQLIKLSPKKTIEGFVGGYFATVIFAVLWGTLFMGWNYMICPVRDLGVTAFSPVECVPNNAFVWRAFEFQGRTIWWTPFQIHCMVLGTFAGLVAPFGGFFASGFKRAFGIKDFSDTIPGHGGLTDRFDCQFIMGLFTHFYYTSLVREQNVTVGSILEIIASSLNSSQQIELYSDLGKVLINKGFQLSTDPAI